jgi:hypothetical protein
VVLPAKPPPLSGLRLRLDRIGRSVSEAKKFSDDDDLISNAFTSHRSAFESHRSSNHNKITPRPPSSLAPNSHRSRVTSINTSLISDGSSLLEKLCEMWDAQDRDHVNISMTKSIDGWKSEFDSDDEKSGVNVREVKHAIQVLRKANMLDADFLSKMNEIMMEPNASSNLELLF